MKLFVKQTRFLAAFLFLFIYSAASSRTINDSLLLGTWQGNLVTIMGDYRLVFHFEKNKDKELTATFQSPEQSDKKFDIDIEEHGDSLSLDLTGVRGNAEYNAVYNKDSAAFFGTFKQSGFRFPLKLIKGELPELLYKRPQTPVKPYPYKEEEVTIENHRGHDTLAGTFTKPKGDGKFPVALLITGSGAQDRNESLLGHKPFLVLSDFLTRKGFAVLRCDDRGTAKSTGDFTTATTADFACDAEAELEYLKTRADVDKDRIGLIGHSEGGMIATMLAAKRSDVAFIVLMAGPCMNLFDMMVMQDSLIALSTGSTEKNIGPYLDRQKKLFRIAMNVTDSTAASDKIDSLLRSEKASDREIEATMKQLLSPWFQWFIKYDPEDDLKKVHCDVLSLGGDKDIQVPAIANAASLKHIFKSARKKNYKAVVLPGLNHLFQHCISCKVSEYKKIDETIDPVALNTIGDWMNDNVLKKKK